jgi:3-isopropylmalate dehydrogenase
MSRKVAVLAGDGIGPEVVAQAVSVLEAVAPELTFEHGLVGGAAIDDSGEPLPEASIALCKKADAVLLGAVGGPKWDKLEPASRRPEVGALLALRSELNLYANLRPAKTIPPLMHASPLRGEQAMVDLLVVRELTGGIYFGEPRIRTADRAVDTCVYTKPEVRRIARLAFRLAAQRRSMVTSVDKANVLETSRLWRETVDEIAVDHPQVSMSHMLVDNCAMQLIRDPGQFDVILTENMFGDILSDEAAMLTGSLGLLPSASLSDGAFGMYEPVHGSAPDIEGQNRANPIATILSGAMMLRHSLDLPAAAARIEAAVEAVLVSGKRTADIFEEGTDLVSCSEMGEAIRQAALG